MRAGGQVAFALGQYVTIASASQVPTGKRHTTPAMVPFHLPTALLELSHHLRLVFDVNTSSADNLLESAINSCTCMFQYDERHQNVQLTLFFLKYSRHSNSLVLRA
jgi:hypothetical protein